MDHFNHQRRNKSVTSLLYHARSVLKEKLKLVIFIDIDICKFVGIALDTKLFLSSFFGVFSRSFPFGIEDI